MMRTFGTDARPGRFRPILTTVVVVVLLTLAWIGLEVYNAWSSKPAVQENFGASIREMAEAWQPGAGPNGWDALVRACEAHTAHVESYHDEQADWSGSPQSFFYETIFDPEATRRFYLDSDYVPSEAEADRLLEVTRGWAIETIESFDELGITADLDRLAASDVFLADWPDSSLEDSLVAYQSLSSESRGLVRGLRARMFFDRNRADWDDYLRSYQHALALGRAYRYQPGTLGSMVGVAAQDAVSQLLREDLVNQRIPQAFAQRVPDIEARLVNGAPMKGLYASERLVFLDSMQRFFDHNGRVVVSQMMGIKLIGEDPEHWMNNLKAITMPRWSTVRRAIEDRFDELEQLAQLPPTRRPEIKQEKGDVIPLYDQSLSMIDRFVRMVSIDAFLRFFDHVKLSEPGHRLLVAIELYRLDHGEPPAELADLVPTYMDAVPVDWFSPQGEPWNYKRLDRPDEFGRTYILYSVGRDATDNGGAHHERSASNALDPDNPGTDYVMNHPSLYQTD